MALWKSSQINSGMMERNKARYLLAIGSGSIAGPSNRIFLVPSFDPMFAQLAAADSDPDSNVGEVARQESVRQSNSLK